MLSRIKEFLGLKKPEITQPVDQLARITTNLGALTNGLINTYNARKAISESLVLSSKSPAELSKWLSESSRISDTLDNVPEKWKTTLRIEKPVLLDDYFTDRGYVVDISQWLDLNKPRIERLVEAFQKMDSADRPYYQRNYNSVLRDTDALLAALVRVSMQ